MNLMARCATAPVAPLKARCFIFGFVRNANTTVKENDDIVSTSTDDDEATALRDLEIEQKRNKSRLFPDHFAVYHGKNPYPEPIYEYHSSLRQKRRSFGRYGAESAVDPSVLWPTKEELKDRKEYESIAYPFSIQEMVAKVRKQREEELKVKLEREASILSKVVKVEQWKKDFHDRVKKKADEAAAAKLKKDRLVEEIRRHFGFKIDPKDDRFKEMVEKKEKEERKLKKAERQKLRDKQLLAQAEEVAIVSKEEDVKQKTEKSEDDSDDEETPISDDEDETHPNIDTPSLFRWRHQARLERMEEMRKEKDVTDQKIKDNERKIQDIKNKIEEGKKSGIDLKDLEKSLEDTEKELKKLKDAEAEIMKKEKNQPWNVDTISKAGFSKTVVNASPRRREEELTDEERERRMREFTEKYEKEIKEYGMMRKYDDSKRYLLEHPHLVCEDTANYLVIWCINLQMREKTSLMEHVAHQCICMQYMLELSKQLESDPRACVSPFYSRIQKVQEAYKQSFDEELEAFKDRIKKRAAEKLEAAIKEAEEEERAQRLGPGGLDPVEVFESLPEVLQKCFESKSIPALNEALSKLPIEEAAYHMKRCIDSGLWVPEANKPKPDEEAAGEEEIIEPASTSE